MADAGDAPEINSALLALVIIFIPGIICYGIIAALAEKKNRSNLTMLMQIFMYGVFSYMFLPIAHRIYPYYFPNLKNIPIFNPSTIEKTPIDPILIFSTSVCGLLEGILITLNLEYQLILKLLQKLRITHRFGDEDVWTLLLNSTDTDYWVTVRYKDRGLIYQGYVKAFSTGAEPREIMLTNVIAYDAETMVEVGKIAFLYLSFEQNSVTLEFGAKPNNVNQTRWRRFRSWLTTKWCGLKKVILRKGG